MIKTTVTFRICNAYNQRIEVYYLRFVILRRHFPDLNFDIDDCN